MERRWTHQGAGQDKGKSNNDENSRRTDWQIYRTWRPLPKLEIYRADSYKSEMARYARTLENFCPSVKIFSLERRNGAQAKRATKKKKEEPGEDRDIDACGQDVEKSTDESLPR